MERGPANTIVAELLQIPLLESHNYGAGLGIEHDPGLEDGKQKVRKAQEGTIREDC
jgi:hypothetical protein